MVYFFVVPSCAVTSIYALFSPTFRFIVLLAISFSHAKSLYNFHVACVLTVTSTFMLVVSLLTVAVMSVPCIFASTGVITSVISQAEERETGSNFRYLYVLTSASVSMSSLVISTAVVSMVLVVLPNISYVSIAA